MILEIKNLSKSFGKIQAVKNLSFHVNRGELFAFLGVNGAGKSTTINIICNQIKKDSGTVQIDGKDSDLHSSEIKKKLGVVYQDSLLDRPLTVYENLKSRAALYGITGKAFKSRLEELAVTLEFENLLKQPVGRLSGGQRRRIDIARALLHRPELLILDEPTTGLDPGTRKTLWNVIEHLRERDHLTVFLTTHYMEEAADADYVVILDHGELIAEGTPLELKNRYTGDFITMYNTKEEDIKKLNVPYKSLKNAFRISVNDTSEATSMILKNPELFRDYEITKGKMDDVFLAVTGKILTGGDLK